MENRFSRSVGLLPETIMFQLVFYYNGYGPTYPHIEYSKNRKSDLTKLLLSRQCYVQVDPCTHVMRVSKAIEDEETSNTSSVDMDI